MPKFFWKTIGTRTPGTVTHVPSTVWLGVIIAISMALATAMTVRVTKQEADYLKRQAEYEKTRDPK